MTRRRLPRDHDLRGDPLALAPRALHTPCARFVFHLTQFRIYGLTHILNRRDPYYRGTAERLFARVFFHSRRDEEPILNRDTSTDIRIIIPACPTGDRINAGRDGVWPG